MNIVDLFTIGEIAEILSEPKDRIAYMVKKHKIKHTRRVANLRLFDSAAIAAIKKGCYHIQIRGG